MHYYYSRQVLNSGDKISYWHKLKSFVPLLGNLLVLCLLLRQEIDPYHFITRISHNSHYQRLYICILFRSDKQLLWYVYDFSIFLRLIQKFFLHMFWLSRFQKHGLSCFIFLVFSNFPRASVFPVVENIINCLSK